MGEMGLKQSQVKRKIFFMIIPVHLVILYLVLDLP